MNVPAESESSAEETPGEKSPDLVLLILLAGLFLFMTADILILRQPRKPLTVERIETEKLGYQIDLNEASLGELQHLPGIGPLLAEKIVADRNAKGKYHSLDELTRVPGVGPKLIDQIRPMIKAIGLVDPPMP